jgi:hypothetical protein
MAAIMTSDAMRRQDADAVNGMLRAMFRLSFSDTSLARQLRVNLD